MPKILILLLFGFSSVSLISQNLEGVRICIDPGHGGYEGDDRQIFLPYGIVYWESEGDLATAFHLKELLESLGATVKLTRSENTNESDISLSQRAAIANTFGADFFHSIHTNGGGGHYSLVLYKEVDGLPAFPQAREMGDIMAPNLEYLMKTTAHYNRGDYSFLGFNLGVLNYANMPSTLSESSFHDVPEEGLRLKNSEYLKNYAWAIARSFLSYFNAGEFTTSRVGGVIRDFTSDEVVNEVRVDGLPGNATYTGDQNYNGFYALGDLAPGDYELVLSKEGYLNDTTTISLGANEYLDLDLTIQYYNNGFPNVDFYISGLPAGAGEVLGFHAEKSSDDGQITDFSWNFGDGSPPGTGIETSHIYTSDGSYDVVLTATDDSGNQSSITKQLRIETFPPGAPKLLSIIPSQHGIGLKISWQKSPESNLVSYLLYVSENEDFSDAWLLNQCDAGQYHFTIDSFGIPGKSYFFRLRSENIVHQLSEAGDTYALYVGTGVSGQQDVLIVNGFNRKASYPYSSHSFVNTYLTSIARLGDFHIASCSNAAVALNEVVLSDYDIVCWFLGDESTADESFSSTEQSRIRTYLEKGGKLFVTGSEVGWDLFEKGSMDDRSFYQQYLKADYLADGGPGRSPARGLANSGFDDRTLHFGVVYPEDFPDEVGEFGGSELILQYDTGAGAGIKFRGYFGESEQEAALVYIGFPLETVGDEEEIDGFLTDVIRFFNQLPPNVISPVRPHASCILYPVPAGEFVVLEGHFTEVYEIQISIIDASGQSFDFLSFRAVPGDNRWVIPVDHLPEGLYYMRLSTETFQQSLRFIIK